MNKNERALNRLKQEFEPDVYLKLLVFFAGETIYFPSNGSRAERQLRNDAIRRDYQENGKSIHDLVNQYSLSESQIRRILSGAG